MHEGELYGATEITVLEGLEPVRRRPEMYVGHVRDGSGLHHLLWGVFRDSLEVWACGAAERIRVDFDGLRLEVEDDSPGIPPDRARIDRYLGTLRGRPSRDGRHPQVHVGPYGVGLAAVNALCREFILETRSAGGLYRTRYERGVCVEPLRRVGDADKPGACVRLEVDQAIFGGEQRFCREVVEARLVPIVRMAAGLRVDLNGVAHHRPDGLRGWVAEDGEIPLEDVLHVRGTLDDVSVDLALGWRPGSGATDVQSYVRFERTPEGGVQERALFAALERALPDGAWPAAREGLVARLHVGLDPRRFGARMRHHLDDAAAIEPVETFVHVMLARGEAGRVLGRFTR